MLSRATYGVGGKLVENIVLISHGGMAEGVKSSLEMIVGKQANVHTVSLRPDSDNLQFEKDLNEKMKALNGSTLIIADLLGGTPCNVAVKNYLEDDEVAIFAGMTLSVVIEAVVNQRATINELLCLAKENIVDVKAGMNQAEQEILEEKQEELGDYSAYAGQENIVNSRIDERLIHGQVAGIWSTSLNTQRIIVHTMKPPQTHYKNLLYEWQRQLRCDFPSFQWQLQPRIFALVVTASNGCFYFSKIPKMFCVILKQMDRSKRSTSAT